MLYSATLGATIIYTTEEGPAPRLKIYQGPLTLEKGKMTIRAKAVRIGFKNSEELVSTFVVE
ncbi:FN3 associated domain-containing protein [Halalkalibacter alkaliphilus]|uniref:Chitobiase/beta-hexosaminidase C-terminal domain-containing protein n=1 Tax=Halalkalibacter alkaliphilus TaxID=2917993 RepID=A0A9X2I7S8_9BACI|nr:FN3 associated domain-containing protein [Halalkalibacter alkaliphilus]MCL7748479.1 chitobiase/beta-hexosaminidase C-terminal domain-containing protein [Halalkalibacter alkaliphilus]